MGFLDKLKSLVDLNPSTPALDPSIFKDELANGTGWTPIKPGGSNFRERKLVFSPDFGRARFKATLTSVIFGGLFLIVGIGVLTAGIVMLAKHGVELEAVFLPLFGLVFASVGLFLIHLFTIPVVFDRSSGFFWKGRVSPEKLARGYDSVKDTTLLSKIHALQIIAEYCSGSGKNSSSYYSYELNIVLEDASRINVVDHGDIKSLKQDAAKLAEFLGVPLWDASAFH